MKTTKRQKTLYTFIVAITYVLIGVLEFFIGPYLLDIITDDYWIELLVYVGFLIVINPFIVAAITGRLPYEIEGLIKVDKPTSINKKEEISRFQQKRKR